MSRLGKNIAANYVGRFGSAVLTLLLTPFYVRLVGIEGYGLIGFYATLMAVFSIITLNLGMTLNREMARFSALGERAKEQEDTAATLERIYWGLAAVICLIIQLGAPLIAGHWVNPKALSPATVEMSIRLMGIAMAFDLPFSLYQGGMMGLQRQVMVNSILLGMVFLRGFGSIAVLVMVAPTVPVFFAWQLVVSLLQAAIFRFAFWKVMPRSGERPRMCKAVIASVWRFSLGMSGISVLGLVLMQTDKVILSKVLPLGEFGSYMLAALVASVLYTVVAPIDAAVFPRFSQLAAGGNERALASLYHDVSQLISLVVMPLAMTLAAASYAVLKMWTGSAEIAANSYIVTSLLLLGTALNRMMCAPFQLQLAYGWTSLQLCAGVISMAFLLPMIIFAAMFYGPIGAACAWLLLNLGYFLVIPSFMHHRLLKNEKWRWYLNDIGVPFLVTLAVVLISSRFIGRGSSIMRGFFLLGGTWAIAVSAVILSSYRLKEYVRRLFKRFSGARICCSVQE